MQAGFAMLEAGSLGVTAVVSVLFKNLGDCLIGAFIWWAVGWAWAYGEVYGDNDENAPITSTRESTPLCSSLANVAFNGVACDQ